MSLSPVPSEQPDATCANCGAQLVADQRYCLSCGQPVSPVRLAFLDVLAPASPAPPAGTAPAAWAPPGTIEVGPANYVAVQSQRGANPWLRRNSGLLGLVAILGLFLLAGLLIGHWVSQSKTPGNTTIKVEGLGGLAAGGAAAGTSPGGSETGAAETGASKTSAKQEAKEAAEGAHETAKEKAPPPAPKKVTKDKINKLTQSKGKKHQEEINALGAEPIETG
ncbi:MAG TPA: zinc ribbon domain-containing protein [Solirubrobacteraceae bacterium]|nr:zinc ribbon domain-containing protein [Solirubrobacteraceae bacterium]